MKNRPHSGLQDEVSSEKRIVLILDNAKCHHAQGAEWVTLSTMRNVECDAYLRRVKTKSITLVEEDGRKRVMPAAKFTRVDRRRRS